MASLAFSADSRLLSVSDSAGVCRVWDLASPKVKAGAEEPDLLVAIAPTSLPAAGPYKISSQGFFSGLSGQAGGSRGGGGGRSGSGGGSGGGGGAGGGRQPQRTLLRGSAAFHPWVTPQGTQTTVSVARPDGDVVQIDLMPGARILLGGEEPPEAEEEGEDPTDTFNLGRGVTAPPEARPRTCCSALLGDLFAA